MTDGEDGMRFEATPGKVCMVIQAGGQRIRMNLTDEQAGEAARGLGLASEQAKDMLHPPQSDGDPVWLAPYCTLEDVGWSSDGTVGMRFVTERQVSFQVRIDAASAQVLARMIEQHLPNKDLQIGGKAQ